MKNLPQYRLNFLGCIVLLVGAVVPTMAFLSLMLGLDFLFHFGINIEESPLISTITNGIMWLGAIFAFDFFICRRQTGMPLKFNFKINNPKQLLLIFPMMFGMMLITEYTSQLIPTEGEIFGELYQYYNDILKTLSQDVVSTVIMTVIMAPIFEEIVFRGIIMKGLIHTGMSANVAIGLSALVFGAVHGNPWQFVGGVLLGFVLGKVYYQTQSLLIPILLHLFNNLVSIVMLYMGIDTFGEIFGLSSTVILGIGILLFFSFYYLFNRQKDNYI